LFTLAGCALFTLFVVGCGPGGPATHEVTGKVTIGGEPAKDLNITFSPVSPDGEMASGSVGADGTYTLFTGAQGTPGAVAGKYKVVLTEAQADMGTAEDAMPDYMETGTDPTAAPEAEAGGIPSEYTSAETSPKEVEVKPGPNTIDIEI
jgi:hypothetical protein